MPQRLQTGNRERANFSAVFCPVLSSKVRGRLCGVPLLKGLSQWAETLGGQSFVHLSS